MILPRTIGYTTGDATDPEGPGPKIICHVCNDIGGWGRGFVLALSRKWNAPEADYREWHRGGDAFELGQVRFVVVESDLTVANMIAQHGIKRGAAGPPIRYEALEACLDCVATRAQETGASIHMPRIGCGLAGGDWIEVESIIVRQLCARDVPVTIYDLSTL